ncbi:MAG: hypothetical protein WC389_10525 [Lutibacter sp.]|jgi:hypothetical protein
MNATEEKKEEILFFNLVNPEEKRSDHKKRLDMLKKKTVIQKNCALNDTYKKCERAEMACYCFIALAGFGFGCFIYSIIKCFF